jgi:4-carboxymuconolactone decarboxylase|tara:strand:+ start:6015 stop:6815 length:801 start_codon:yes stop_codon:yes gene_type:complete
MQRQPKEEVDVKLSLPLLAVCILSLAACDAAVVVEAPGPTATPEPATPNPTEPFTPREVTTADIPPDIQEDSWARLPTITRESLDADGQRAFDVIVNPDSRYDNGLRGPIGMWMYSPGMAEHLFPASTYLRYGADGNRDQRLTELAILTAARALDSQYEWSAHEGLGRNAGLEEEIIELLRFGESVDGAAVPGLGDKERTIVQMVRELIHEPKVSAETFETGRRLFGETGLMDLAGLVGHYTIVNYTLKTFDVQRTPGSRLLLPLP